MYVYILSYIIYYEIVSYTATAYYVCSQVALLSLLQHPLLGCWLFHRWLFHQMLLPFTIFLVFTMLLGLRGHPRFHSVAQLVSSVP